ncbi:MAG: hypothetical protein R2710_05790 [Acidimicrobiales bacterium]
MTVFVAIQVLVFATALSFCVLGAVVNRLRNRRDEQRAIAHHWAATVVLDAGPDLEAAGRALADLPISVLAEVLQHLSADTTGEARRRLQVVAHHAGLTHRIERLVHRHSWNRRVQGAHLMMLLPDDGIERSMLLDDPHPFVRARAIRAPRPRSRSSPRPCSTRSGTPVPPFALQRSTPLLVADQAVFHTSSST